MNASLEGMNHLQQFKALKNRYIALRHGLSVANEEGIIISKPENGIGQYGLVDKGRREVRVSVAMAVEEGIIDRDSLIIASDFQRTFETGEITQKTLGGNNGIFINPKLRERNFGEFEKKSNKNYQTVWTADGLYPHHGMWAVESANDVQTRTTLLISELEERYTGKTFILASHGDSLQILETGFRKISPKHHRQLEPLKTGEIRELTLSTVPNEKGLITQPMRRM